MQTQRTRILMVCLGNICRSPTAEGVLRQLAHKRGLADRFDVASAGTSGHWHEGEQADPRTRQHAIQRGYDLQKHRARGLRTDDFVSYDYLLAMDHDNLAEMKRKCPTAHAHKLHMLMDFARDTGDDNYVPDPYYDGSEAFELVLDLCERGCSGFIDHVLAQRTPSNAPPLSQN